MAVRYSEVIDDAGQRIDNYLLRELNGVPRSRVYRMLRKGEVRVNGGRIRPDYRLREGDVVRLPPYRQNPAGAQDAAGSSVPAPPQKLIDRLEGSILHEDENLLVIDKPCGIAVHGGSGIALGVIETLRVMRPDVRRLELGHRIDRDTSGCLVLTKNRATLLALHESLRENKARKRYEVIVWGEWPARRRTVQTPLRRYVTRSGERRVAADVDGKPARTDYEILATHNHATRLSAFPRTGRTHQIRVHCQTSGAPIVGDQKYGSDTALKTWKQMGIDRLALHAAAFRFVLDGTAYNFDAATPTDFEAIWTRLTE